MKINLSSDEINLLVHRYLIENGYVHTAFTFTTEAGMSKNPFWLTHCDKLPPNALISFLQKAMLYIYIEYHTDDETGEEIHCDEPFSFFKRHECWSYADENNTNNSSFNLCMYNVNINTSAATNSNNASSKIQNNNHKNVLTDNNLFFEDKIDNSSAFPFVSFSSSSAFSYPRKVGRPPTKGGRGKKRQRTDRISSLGGSGVSCEEEEMSGVSAGGLEKDDDSVESNTPNSVRDQVQPLRASYIEDEKQKEKEKVKDISSYLLPLPERLSSPSNHVYRGPPHFDLKAKKKVQNLLYLVENEFSADAGALSEWSPTDPNLVVTNFAVGSPCLYRLPSKISSIYYINYFKELEGPSYCVSNNNNSSSASNSSNTNNNNSSQLNSGSSTHWKSDGSLIATGYESGDVCIWNEDGEFLLNLHVSDTSVICVAFSYTSGAHLAAASADGSVCVYFIQEHVLAKHVKETTVRKREENTCSVEDEYNHSNSVLLAQKRKKNKVKMEEEKTAEKSDFTAEVSVENRTTNEEPSQDQVGSSHPCVSHNNSADCDNRIFVAKQRKEGESEKQENQDEILGEKLNGKVESTPAEAPGDFVASDDNCGFNIHDALNVIKKEETVQEAEDGLSTHRFTKITYSTNIDYSQGALSNIFTTSVESTTDNPSTNTFTHSKTSITKQLQFFSVHTYQHGGGVIDIDWKDDEVLASGSIDGSIIVCDLKRQKIITLSLQSESSKSDSEKQRCEIAAVRWDGTGKRLSIVDSSSVVKIWKPHALEGESNMVELHGHLEPVIKMEWTNKNSQNSSPNCLITVSMDKQLIMWDADSAAILNSVTYEHPPTTLRMSRDCTKLAVGTYDNGLRIYSIPSMQLLCSFYDNMVITHVTWNSDNDRLGYNIFNKGKTVILSPKL